MAKVVAEYDLDEMFPHILQPSVANLVEVFDHDVIVKQIGTKQVMSVSYWDGGYVLLDVTDPLKRPAEDIHPDHVSGPIEPDSAVRIPAECRHTRITRLLVAARAVVRLVGRPHKASILSFVSPRARPAIDRPSTMSPPRGSAKAPSVAGPARRATVSASAAADTPQRGRRTAAVCTRLGTAGTAHGADRRHLSARGYLRMTSFRPRPTFESLRCDCRRAPGSETPTRGVDRQHPVRRSEAAWRPDSPWVASPEGAGGAALATVRASWRSWSRNTRVVDPPGSRPDRPGRESRARGPG